VYTRGEGEFAALGVEQARQRLAWARECFARRGWQAQGFVAPAWLLSEGSWQALREAGFGYTTSFSRFYLLREGRSLFAPSLVYSSRNGWGSALSRSGTSVSAQLLRAAPLLRLALHPQDANHRSTLLHCQRLVEQLLQTRDAMTKMEFAQRWSARCHDDASPNRFRASDRPV
jgi:predicted deacetylase